MKHPGPGLAVLLLVLCPAAARAEHTVARLDFSAMAAAKTLIAGRVEAGALVLTGSSTGPSQPRFAVIERPAVGLTYAVVGRVSATDVEGTAYLELWSHIEGKGAFFSRTLGPGGPMGALHGSEASRRFVLPFDATGAAPPTRLELGVHFDGKGELLLEEVELIALDSPADLPRLMGASSVIGAQDGDVGKVGATLGVFFGLLGALSGILVGRGRGRALVLGLWLAALVLSGLIGAGGLTWLLRGGGQPSAIALSVIGLGGAGLAALMFALAKRRYAEVELRRMRAMDQI